jgi:acyl-CoA synthetase (AMP-forming)/AMP-acid ligase II
VNTLVEMLRRRADAEPASPVITFLDGEGGSETITYAELDRRARGVAGLIRAAGVGEGERALLLYPPGLDYVAALFGTLYAGAVPVPAYPPDPARLNRTVPRLLSILDDARASALLTLDQIRLAAGEIFGEAAALREATTIATDVGDEEAAEDWREPRLDGDSLAILQYTSGSTATPRGVMVSHRNVLANLAFATEGFALGPECVGVHWLPPYHDMGLIGAIFEPIYAGFPVVSMSPLSFLRRPQRWLRAISDHGGTVSGGPNFAFDMCARRVSEEERETLDLSRWSLAFNGAEPVLEDTVRAFVDAFGPCGFRAEAFYPCYGLAESTLMVSGDPGPLLPLHTLSVEVDALEAEHRAVTPPAADARARTLIGCGRAGVDNEIRIVDPETLEECAEREVGEIWTRGPSVAGGYWGRPDESEAVFRVRLRGGSEPYLRTGDLGFLDAGELYVTGRLKDLILVGGRNFYPTDVELACAEVAGVRRSCSAAFAVEHEGRDHVVVVSEVATEGVDPAAVVDGVRAAVAAALELRVQGVALIAPRSLPKTSSGKVQRYACREEYLGGGLEIVHEWAVDGLRRPAPAR